METSVNVGDILAQLFALGIPIIFIVVLFFFWRSGKKKREQLKRIEEKLDALQKTEK